MVGFPEHVDNFMSSHILGLDTKPGDSHVERGSAAVLSEYSRSKRSRPGHLLGTIGAWLYITLLYMNQEKIVWVH